MTGLFFVFFVLFVAYFVSSNESDSKVLNLERSVANCTLRADSLRREIRVREEENDQLRAANNLLDQRLHFGDIKKGLKERGFRYLPDCNKFVFEPFLEERVFDFKYDLSKKPVRVNLHRGSAKVRKMMGVALRDFLRDFSEKHSKLPYTLIVESAVVPFDTILWTADPKVYNLTYNMVWKLYHGWEQAGISLDEFGIPILLSEGGYQTACQVSWANSRQDGYIFVKMVPGL